MVVVVVVVMRHTSPRTYSRNTTPHYEAAKLYWSVMLAPTVVVALMVMVMVMVTVTTCSR